MSLTRVRSAAARAASTHLPAFGLFVLITVIMTWPYTRQIQTSLYNWTDALLNTWTLAWGVHALLTNPLNLYNAISSIPIPIRSPILRVCCPKP